MSSLSGETSCKLLHSFTFTCTFTTARHDGRHMSAVSVGSHGHTSRQVGPTFVGSCWPVLARVGRHEPARSDTCRGRPCWLVYLGFDGRESNGRVRRREGEHFPALATARRPPAAVRRTYPALRRPAAAAGRRAVLAADDVDYIPTCPSALGEPLQDAPRSTRPTAAARRNLSLIHISEPTRPY